MECQNETKSWKSCFPFQCEFYDFFELNIHDVQIDIHMIMADLYIDFQMQATVFKVKNVKPTVDKTT